VLCNAAIDMYLSFESKDACRSPPQLVNGKAFDGPAVSLKNGSTQVAQRWQFNPSRIAAFLDSKDSTTRKRFTDRMLAN
jgi:hypothetical protein